MIANNPMRPVCEYATDSQYKEAPNQEQLSCGVIPLDSLPAEWWNYLWGNANQQINNGVVALNNVIAEIVNVMSAAGISPVSECTDQLKSSIQLLAQCIGTSTKAGAVKSSSTCGQVSISSTGIMTANGLGNASNLTTTNKGNVVAAINELKSQHEQQITELESQVQGLQDSTVTGVKLNSSGTAINPTSGIINLGLGSAAKCDASCFLASSSLTAYAKQKGYFTGASDSWVCCANNTSCLGEILARCYALKTDTVANASCLGGCLASCYALLTSTVACATNAATATNATKLGGTAAACYALKSGSVTSATTATTATCLGGVLAACYALKTDTVADANCLGGTAAACYALKTGTVANASCLGGCLASCYALLTSTVACATTAVNATKLGGTKAACYALLTSTVACATNAATATNATKLGGTAAACYALLTSTVACATTAAAATNADCLGGTVARDYALKTDKAPSATVADTANCLGGVLASCYALLTSTVANASSLGGTAAACYALKTDTVANASCLGECLASCYALKTGTVACATNAATATNATKLGGTAAACYALLTSTVACATTAVNATKLGGVVALCYPTRAGTIAYATCLGSSSAYYTKATLDTALAGKAPTNHASEDTTYGVASPTNYGHVKLHTTNTSSDFFQYKCCLSGSACTYKYNCDAWPFTRVCLCICQNNNRGYFMWFCNNTAYPLMLLKCVGSGCAPTPECLCYCHRLPRIIGPYEKWMMSGSYTHGCYAYYELFFAHLRDNLITW